MKAMINKLTGKKEELTPEKEMAVKKDASQDKLLRRLENEMNMIKASRKSQSRQGG